MKLILKRDWIGPKGVMYAGEYSVPRQISKAHARCAQADGAGVFVRDATPASPIPTDGVSDNPASQEAADKPAAMFPEVEHKEQRVEPPAASPTPTPEPARTLTSKSAGSKSAK